METFDSHSTRGKDSFSGRSFGDLIGSSECISRSDSFDEAIAPQSYCGDPAAIARCIFRDELADVLKVLRNCGALRTAGERRWCVEELGRLLAKPSPGDLT